MHMVKKTNFDKGKLKQVLHYVISETSSLSNVGKTLLYKILYFSDFDFYELNEKPLTGEIYFKLPMGPAPSNFDETISELKKEKKVKEVRAKYRGFRLMKFISLCKPTLNLINGDELEVINKVIQRLSSMTATQVTAYSHEDLPWKATEDRKQMPIYNTRGDK